MNKIYEYIVLPINMQNQVAEHGETKMGGFQTGTVSLKDGRKIFVTIDYYKYIFYAEGYSGVPFSEHEIERIKITHKRPDMEKYTKRVNEVREMKLFHDGKAIIEESLERNSDKS